MVHTIEELRALGFAVPTDEEIAQRVEEKRQQDESVRNDKIVEADRKIQSLQDQLRDAEAERSALDAQG